MDTVGDALIRIKNGYSVGKVSVVLKFSKLVLNLVKLLQKEGYLAEVKQDKREIIVTLKYNFRIPSVTHL